MKRFFILILIIFSLTLVSCAKNEPNLHKAVENMQTITAMESETKISFSFEGINLSTTDQGEFKEIQELMNDLIFTFNHKFIRELKPQNSKSESKINLGIGGISFNTTVFNDVNLTEETIKFIIETPTALKDLVPFLNLDKQYIVIDVEETIGDERAKEDIDFEQVLKHQKQTHARIIDLANDVQKRLNPDFDIISQQADKQQNGETVEVYTLQLDDPTFKELLRTYLETILEDEKIRQELDIEEADYQEDFKDFMDKLEKMQILGPEGVKVEYLINQAGYVKEVNGIVDFLFDLDNLREQLDATIGSSGQIHLQINFTTVNSNINGDVSVQIPELTNNNSATIAEILNFGAIFDNFEYNYDDSYDDYVEQGQAYFDLMDYAFDLYYDGALEYDELMKILAEADNRDSEVELLEYLNQLKAKYE